MSFISYAQNFEDVMLWRALKHIEKGFYIDIGAQDPVIDSVSQAFYEHGWRGVHVEPNVMYAQKLRNARKDETVFQVAISDHEELLSFYEIADTGLSTGDADIAEKHRLDGFSVTQTEIQAITLDTLFNKFGNQEIHWMKIDVEGMEESVLQGWRASLIRPWIIVVESTIPCSQEQANHKCKMLLTEKMYRFVYSDGLNRFYISTDHPELAASFLLPPNLFDCFVLSGYATHTFCQLIEFKAQQAEDRVQQAEDRVQQAEDRVQQAEVRAQEAERSLTALESSYSYRMTFLLRYVEGKINYLNHSSLRPAKLKRSLRKRLVSIALYVNNHSPNLLKIQLNKFPSFKSKLKRTIFGKSQPLSMVQSIQDESLMQLKEKDLLTKRALRIYFDLKKAVERQHREVR